MTKLFRCVDDRLAYLAGLLSVPKPYTRKIFSANEVPIGQEFKQSLVEVIGECSGIRSCVDAYPQTVNINPIWMCQEIAQFMDARDPKALILAWLPEDKVRRFHNLDADGRIENHYGYVPETFARVVRMLCADPESKRAVVPFYTTLQETAGEVPCALTTQYLLRDDRLWTVNAYRSHDYFAGVRTDAIRISVAQQYIAWMLSAEPGPMVFQEGSLHYYPGRKHAPLAKLAAGTCADHKEMRPFEESVGPQDDVDQFIAAFKSAKLADTKAVGNGWFRDLLMAAHVYRANRIAGITSL